MDSNNQQSEHPLSQYNAYCNSLNVGLDKLPKYEDWLEAEVIRLQARIEAAAAIPEDFPAFGYPIDYARAEAANEMRAQFRAALEIE